MVVFDGVGLRYGRGPAIFSDVSLTLTAGSFHFLVGPSGAGKSSFLRLMYLAARPAEGRMTLFGRQIGRVTRHELPSLRRRIGVVFQDFRLLDHLSAFDNVALPLRVAGEREGEIRRNVTELLSWVGLADELQSLPPTLSGGQQQRVAIARAVVGRPELLLADEPTGNVDDAIAVRLMYLFEELNRLGTTVIIATHNQGLVDRFDHPQIRIAEGHVGLVERTSR